VVSAIFPVTLNFESAKEKLHDKHIKSLFQLFHLYFNYFKIQRVTYVLAKLVCFEVPNPEEL